MQQNTFVQSESTFQIYNASAGSGKTFTLVKEYLKIVLIHKDVFTFQNILAITFTNKAAAEMKHRIVNSLKEFSEGINSPLKTTIQKETNLDEINIQLKSKKILHLILQNYSAFHITTIDSFTYRIIKKFAFDLGLSQNFEVEMNAQEILDQAVKVLISRIGKNKELTDVLIEYSLDKVDDDKSWDISRELTEFSKILLNEDDLIRFRKLSDKTLQDFKNLQLKITAHQKELIKKMRSIGERALQTIENNNLEFKDFYKSMFPNHFLSLVNTPEKTKFFDQSTLKSKVDNQELYSKSKPKDLRVSIEEILPTLKILYKDSELLYQQLLRNRLVLKAIIPLAVLNNINQELTTIKEDNNIRLNAEFNQLISDHIQDQPAPFIYERIGQKFMHYFIDEMQDTSVLQWQNLLPLIDNSLAQENTSLLLVGDGKQAVYRWRGGKAEQFIELGSESEMSNNPFLIKKKILELKINYRSYSEIINFNNSFFKHVSNFLQNKSYSNLFLNNSHQEENENKGGFISLSFLEKLDNKEEDALKYADKVYQIIKKLKSKISLGTICILVRKRSEGVVVANHLSENNIEIVSSETLLLCNSKKVNFIINFLKYTQQTNDKESLFEVLNFLHAHLDLSVDKHIFLTDLIHLEIEELLNELKEYQCNLNMITYHQNPLYEKVEQVIRSFHLQDTTDAYIQFFLDEVLIQQQKESGVQDFLDFWENKKDTLSVVTSENPNAVKIMTIHKSKGLEFPIIILPCDLNIYQDIKPKTWLENHSDNFQEIMVPLTKEIQHVDKKGKEIYNNRRAELELDSFNLLYVALTRAVEQLYIITEKKINKSGLEDLKYYSGIFISFLKEQALWDVDQNEYTFGSPELKSFSKKESISFNQERFISRSWKNQNIKLLANSSKLWGTQRGFAKDYGTFIHKILSEVFIKKDIEEVIGKYRQLGEISAIEESQLKKKVLNIISHPRLTKYYSENVKVLNEREIITNHHIVIPDRLVFDNYNKVVIIDYKTGVFKKEHYTQLENYENVLKSIGYKTNKKVLIYINESITVKEF